MIGALRQYLAIALGIVAFIGGAIGFLLPEGTGKSDRLGLWLFVLETFAWELCTAGLLGLAYVVIKHSPFVRRTVLQELSLLWNPQRNLLVGVPRSEVARARFLAFVILAGSGTLALVLLGSIGWWSWKYVEVDLFLTHYRKESLLLARAAHEAGYYEKALVGYERFAEMFPDRVHSNKIDRDSERIRGRQKAALDIEQRAVAHRAKYGLNPEAIAMLASAVDLDFGHEKRRALLAQWLKDAKKVQSNAAAWIDSCKSAEGKSETLTSFVATFLDAVSWSLLSDAAKGETLRLACTEFATREDDWTEVGAARWRIGELEEFLETTAVENREAVRERYLQAEKDVRSAGAEGSRIPFIDRIGNRLVRLFSQRRDTRADERPVGPIRVDNGERFPIAVADSERGEYSFHWPLSGVVVANFKETNHRGVDISAAPGSPVKASQSGLVGYTSDSLFGYGRTVVVVAESEKIATIYARLGDIRVKPGDAVRHGDLLGFASDDRAEVAEPVRFEVRIDGVPNDPLAPIAAARARASHR